MDQNVVGISQFCYKIIALHGRHRQDFLGQERTSRSQFISLIHNPLFIVEWLQFSNIAVSKFASCVVAINCLVLIVFVNKVIEFIFNRFRAFKFISSNSQCFNFLLSFCKGNARDFTRVVKGFLPFTHALHTVISFGS